MDIQIAAGSTLPNPAAGYRTLFINTEDSNILSWKNSDGTIERFSEDMDMDCCACEISKVLAEAAACAVKSGKWDETDFKDWITQGYNVKVVETDDGDGNKTCEVTVGPKTADIPPTELAIIPADNTIVVAATKQFYPQFTPANTTDQSVIWISSDPSKATVSAAGLVTGVALGVATIYAYSVADNAISASRVITVS
jgi:uncharacterized protein YjdB